MIEICKSFNLIYDEYFIELKESFNVIKEYYDQKHSDDEKFQDSCDLILKKYLKFEDTIQKIIKEKFN